MLAAAHAGHAPAQGRAEVARIVAQLDGEQVGYATVFARLLRAGLGADAGVDPVRELRQAVAVAAEHDMAIQRAAAQTRLAELCGGAEGAALRADVARYVADHGIVEPERFFAIAAPGRAR